MINPLQVLNKIPDAFWKICVAVLLILVITFGIQTCNKTEEAHKLQNQLTTEVYNHKMVFDSIRLKDGSTIATQQQLIAQKDNEIVKHIETENGLKSLVAQVSVKTSYKIDSIFIPYYSPAPVITIVDTVAGKLDTTDYIRVPAVVHNTDTNFLLQATVIKTGLVVNNLNILNTVTVTIGETKGLFKHQSIVSIKQSNPYIKTEDVKNIVVQQTSQKKEIKTFFIGGGIGAAVATTLIILLTHFVIK